ncbi:hypothetical protein LIER_38185 [Lithospermum erythrorhizon]|uniref:Uncharacterized protein n=1 Tax=Lithospermum erythrorhizon TaxID=34254 RepID=A0AAV3Q127_LITER
MKHATLKRGRWYGNQRLKNQSVWGINARSVDSWSLNKLLQLRDFIKPHVKKVIRDGESTNFLYDNWHQYGVLASLLSRRSINTLQVLQTDSVVEFVRKVK